MLSFIFLRSLFEFFDRVYHRILRVFGNQVFIVYALERIGVSVALTRRLIHLIHDRFISCWRLIFCAIVEIKLDLVIQLFVPAELQSNCLGQVLIALHHQILHVVIDF